MLIYLTRNFLMLCVINEWVYNCEIHILEQYYNSTIGQEEIERLETFLRLLLEIVLS